ncbi:hypothetical protein LSH36_839g05054 [Paralvinella palmiformis]|uniref:Uncharacterized protein n=1 Tax=Paralvinella palmiformis TaxID=53620 RepID=A0AAD9MRV7_9ANNE|nr:hypothetical protein LSH36_839g05054 [Paralvinella palmiformis]
MALACFTFSYHVLQNTQICFVIKQQTEGGGRY